MGIDQERHRPGMLKQQNKPHKHGRHRSKGAIGNVERGRVSVKHLTRRLKSHTSKDERRNQIVQNRLKKRQEALHKKRQLGGSKTPPFLVAVIPLAFDADVKKVIQQLIDCSDPSDIARSNEGVLHIRVPRLKQRFSFVVPEKGNTYAILDTLKVADTVLFVTSALSNPFMDSVAKNILIAVLAQGLPSTAVAVVEMENVPVKKRSACKQELQKVISQWLPEEKVICLDKSGDAFNLFRKIGGQKRRGITQRDHRPHLLAEHVEFTAEDNSASGTLKVSGYLRGQLLNVNSLVHIPGWGDFQMKQIDGMDDPQPLINNKSEEMSSVTILQVADPAKQISLASENEPDLMDTEQTWPTHEELESAKQEQKQKKLVKRVPKGMSDYQACWIPDEDIEELDEDFEEEDDNEMEVQSEENSDDERKDEEEYETVTVTEGDVDAERYDEKMDMDEEAKAKAKLMEAKEDRMFPDEVDTPQDIPARERFQKYRGLSSFRTSPWDLKENLPCDYARIYQFENFNRTRKRIFSELEKEIVRGITPGQFITIHIAGVPTHKFESRRSDQPLVVYGMLEHEQRMTVVNMVVKRCPNSSMSQLPISSKEELVFQCGYRRYKGRPIFSQHTNGNKHKYERYFQPDTTTVATLYAPVIFPPASVLLMKEKPDGEQVIVATGNVLSVNPDRLVIKRVVLSGHPLKVHKRSAVIRFMFFNREDIDWFKPVELRTKYGRRGHIREPLGTHGHMKTIFDGQLKSQDTILMYLYKRVFPKWSFDPDTKYTSSMYKTMPTIAEEDEDMED